MSADVALQRMVEIHFPVGLHVRPATIIAQKARGFETEVFLIFQDRRVSTRNVFDMFLLGAEKGSKIRLEAGEGQDAETALETLVALFAPDCLEMKVPEE